MKRRWRRRLCVGMLGLLPLGGCLPPTSNIFLAPASTGAELAGADDKTELPPKETARVCLALAESYEKRGYDGDAILQFEKARQEDPNLHRVARRLAVLYDRVGDSKRAIAEYQEALKASPRDAGLLNDIGYCYYNRGQWSEAESYYRKALAVNSKHAHAWGNLGMTLAQEAKYDDSLKAFQHVVSPGEAQANVAFIMIAQGKREEARQALRQALKLESDLRVAQVALDRLDHPEKTTSPGAGVRSSKGSSAAPKGQQQAAKIAPPVPESAPEDKLPDLSPITVDPKTQPAKLKIE